MIEGGCRTDDERDTFVQKLVTLLEDTSEARDEDSCEAALSLIANLGTEHGETGVELLDMIVPDILHVVIPCAALTPRYDAMELLSSP